MDFAFLPVSYGSFDTDTSPPRVPILPDNYAVKTNIHSEPIEPVMRAEIVTAAGDSAHTYGPSAMSEVTDNHALEIDPFELEELVKKAASAARDVATSSQDVSTIKAIWNGLLDDLFGGKNASPAGGRV